VSQIFLEVQVAEKWRLTPSEFRAKSIDDQAEMLAYTRDTAKMAEYETYLGQSKHA
jgi:hypothetical protein